MRIDATLVFASGLSLVAGSGVAIASTVIDLLGVGSGNAPPGIIGNATTFGTDLGVGDGFVIPKLQCNIGTAATTSNSATLNVQFQGAPDTATTYVPGTWTTLVETGAIAVGSLTAGAVIARFDWPPAVPPGILMRYVRLNFAVAAATAFTAGTIGFAGVVPLRDDQANKYAAGNFTVA